MIVYRILSLHCLTTRTGPGSKAAAAQPGDCGGSRQPQSPPQSTAVEQRFGPSTGHGRGKRVGRSESQLLHPLADSWTSQLLAQLAQLFTAAWPIQLCVREGDGRYRSFSAAVISLRLLPYSSTLKVCVRSGILMVYSPTGASAAKGKDRSTMPPTGITFSHCAIRFPLGSCIGNSRE